MALRLKPVYTHDGHVRRVLNALRSGCDMLDNVVIAERRVSFGVAYLSLTRETRELLRSANALPWNTHNAD